MWESLTKEGLEKLKENVKDQLERTDYKFSQKYLVEKPILIF